MVAGALQLLPSRYGYERNLFRRRGERVSRENIRIRCRFRTRARRLAPRQRRVVLGIMVSGTTAACISQSMMIAALPAVMHEYGISASSGQLLTTAYILYWA